MPVDPLLTLEEACALCRVPKSWMYERTRRGLIPHLKLGNHLRFDRGDLLAWLEAHKRGASKNDYESRLAETLAGHYRAHGRQSRGSKV
jgi:excisionase family DNA binding protein